MTPELERDESAVVTEPAASPGETRPDFFIVGAFKAGTTALYEYLRLHPQVFMPFLKEPHFFGDDLTRHYGRMSLGEYLALFRDARPGQRVGEASTWYLYSSSAAREIAGFSPKARIIVMLRNPVDVMHAQHSQLLFRGDEDLADFGQALDAEPARRRGERLRPPPVRPETLFYRHSVQFSAQLERYFQVFGQERVHVILFDDFVSDTVTVFRGVLEFLDIDAGFRPQFKVHNENKRVRNATIQRLVYGPPGPLLGAARRLRRFPLMHRLRDSVLQLNSSAQRRQPMDPDLRDRLITEFEPEFERLSSLIRRDLSRWAR